MKTKTQPSKKNQPAKKATNAAKNAQTNRWALTLEKAAANVVMVDSVFGRKYSSPPPSECLTALVRPDDAKWIAAMSMKYESPPWIVASVLAGIGNEAIGGEHCADRVAALLKKTPNDLLWRCIFRNAKEFTVRIPIYYDEEYFWSVEETAKSMGRTCSDWLGSILKIGIEVMATNPDLSFMNASQQFKLMADGAELRMCKEMEEQ